MPHKADIESLEYAKTSKSKRGRLGQRPLITELDTMIENY